MEPQQRHNRVHCIRRHVAIFVLFALSACSSVPLVEWRHGDTVGDALICVPQGEPPFPVVVFHHGVYVDLNGLSAATGRGYDPSGICKAFAKDGFLAFMPVRRTSVQNPRGQFAETQHAFAAAQARPDADPARVSVAGVSRGGLLTLMTAIQATPAYSFVILAPAPGRGNLFQRLLGQVGNIDAPVLMMVENSDDEVIIRDVDELEAALREAGKPHRVFRYNRGGGHDLFLRADYYWPDLIAFLRDPEGN